VFAGAIAYADDVVFMSALVVQLQNMLDICTTFGLCCDIKFNVQKCCYGCFGKLLCNSIPKLCISRIVLKQVNYIKFLGVNFVVGKKLQVDCSHRIQKFIAVVCFI
jgi:hypothetical protein